MRKSSLEDKFNRMMKLDSCRRMKLSKEPEATGDVVLERVLKKQLGGVLAHIPSVTGRGGDRSYALGNRMPSLSSC